MKLGITGIAHILVGDKSSHHFWVVLPPTNLGIWPESSCAVKPWFHNVRNRIMAPCSAAHHDRPLSSLVGGWPTPLKNMSSSVGMIIPNIWENKKCSKPLTSWHLSKTHWFLAPRDEASQLPLGLRIGAEQRSTRQELAQRCCLRSKSSPIVGIHWHPWFIN